MFCLWGRDGPVSEEDEDENRKDGMFHDSDNKMVIVLFDVELMIWDVQL